MIVATPNETKFYVTNTVSGSVSVIDRSTGEVKVVSTGPGTEGIAISPDGKEVWAASRLDDKISIISTATDTIVATFPSGGKGPKRMDFTPDGTQVWVTNPASNQATVFDAHGARIARHSNFCQNPRAAFTSPPTAADAFITNANANELTFIDVASRKILSTMPIGTDPDGVAWSSVNSNDGHPNSEAGFRAQTSVCGF